ncbi:MAG: (2Fe-2S)-binding protein [Proteobacteria bacterium]|nr:(2Fe-2S)-binding protein [Pseudomonadota bacterium]
MAESFLLSFQLNGEPVEVAAPPHYTLLEVLRYKLDLIGSKQGCDKGDCGACTVQIDRRPVLSCITLGVHVQGREVVTVEGLTRPGMHPLHDCFDKWVAAQCGFCTPGILMAAEAYLSAVGRKVTRGEVAEALASNLCRCTGYTKIVDAIVEASELMAAEDEGKDDHRRAGNPSKTS